MALAEIGRYTGVDRLATWENHLDGVTYGCTNEWCNDGIEPAIDYLRSMTIEAGKPWFDVLEENHIICTSDIYSLDPLLFFPCHNWEYISAFFRSTFAGTNNGMKKMWN